MPRFWPEPNIGLLTPELGIGGSSGSWVRRRTIELPDRTVTIFALGKGSRSGTIYVRHQRANTAAEPTSQVRAADFNWIPSYERRVKQSDCSGP